MDGLFDCFLTTPRRERERGGGREGGREREGEGEGEGEREMSSCNHSITYLITTFLIGACLLPFSVSICAPVIDLINANLLLPLPTTELYLDPGIVIFLVLQ